ncbi:DUF4440 domain-containing protein [Pedobacter yulinensis]|uniref:DUF4440 domain-containing protein n=1 Tax=Pedobacter yulinensis TaxID=2126353 RepID=A0A2T3HKX4_9SPHI|nr:nuclear transport factor 2 family protein [Pedobacter yulinensis]PST83080.1 DUF4440 domain-containing protein [Pedobacter yulinensis]
MIQSQHIAALEEKLIGAIRNSDLAVLDQLLHDKLLFTNHLGYVMNKEQDLASHRSGALSIAGIVISNQQIRLIDDCAVVSVRKRVSGSYAGAPFDDELQFTRVWKQVASGWKVIAASSVKG